MKSNKDILKKGDEILINSEKYIIESFQKNRKTGATEIKASKDNNGEFLKLAQNLTLQ